MRLLALSGVALILVATLSACMTSVTNGMTVCGTDAEMTLAGYSPEPSTRVTIEAAAKPEGPFVTIGSVRAGDLATTLGDGTKIYGWSTTGSSPAWAKVDDATRVTYVRAWHELTQNGRVYSRTFDVGTSGEACVLREINEKKKNAAAALAACESEAHGLARVLAPKVSKCEWPVRPWERGCKRNGASVVSRRFIVLPKVTGNTIAACTSFPRDTGWAVTSTFSGGKAPTCNIAWTLARNPNDDDKDVLERWADLRAIPKPLPNGDVDSNLRNHTPAILADCAASRAACSGASCAGVTAAKILPTRRARMRELVSGCPKCAVIRDESIYVVLPPDYAAGPVVLTAPENGEGALRFDPAGQQVFVVQLPEDGTRAMTIDQAFETFRPLANGVGITVTPATWYDARSTP